MDVAVLTCLNERPQISRVLFGSGIGDLYKVYAAVSTDEDERLVREYNCTPVRQTNTTAGHKWNAVLNYALKNTEHTHFIIMGDDDSISIEATGLLEVAMTEGHTYAGFKSNYFVDVYTGEAHSHTQRYQADKLCGAGSIISRKAIMDACMFAEVDVKRPIVMPFDTYQRGKKYIPLSMAKYLDGYMGMAKIQAEHWVDLWPPKSNGLDAAREMRLVMAGHPPKAIETDKIHVTDFKSSRNIWTYDSLNSMGKFTGPAVSFDEATWFMSDEEKDYILSLRK